MNDDDPARNPFVLRHAGLLIFLIAFAIRGITLFSHMTPQKWIFPETTSEAGRATMNLHETGRLADPYVIPTGPTAHALPIDAVVVVVLYKIFGVTLTAGYARCLIHITAYSLMYALLPWAGTHLGVGRRAGMIGGLAGALVPYQALGEVLGWGSNEPYAAISLIVLTVALVRRWQADRPPLLGALAIGLGFGVAFHFAPAILLVWLACMTFELYWMRRERFRSGAAVMILGAALVSVPWTWRNYSVLGDLFFVRSNFGLELRMGNHEGAVADVEAMDRREGDGMPHPGINLTEAQLCRDLGEAEYMRRARSKAFSWIRANPREFLRLTGCRFLHTWFGPWYTASSVAAFITLLTILGAIGLWRAWPAMSVPQRVAVLSPIVFFPLVYYVVVYMPRYRVPIDWVVFLAAGAAIWPARRSALGSENPTEGGDSTT